MTYVRPTAPSDLFDVVGTGFSLFRTSITSLYLPAFLLALTAMAIDPLQAPFKTEGQYLEVVRDHWFRCLVPVVVYFYLYAIITANVHYMASGAPRGVRSPLAIATLRFPTILAVNLLFVLAVGIGMLLLIVPGIFLLVALYFGPMLPITEARGPLRSLGGSFELVDGYWWHVFAIIGIAFGTALVIGLPAEMLIRFCADWFESAPVANTVSTLIRAASEAIIHPLALCFAYAMYQDLRLRRKAGGVGDTFDP